MSTATFTQGSVAQYATSATLTVSSLLTQAGYSDPDGKGLAQGIAIVATAGTAYVSCGRFEALSVVAAVPVGLLAALVITVLVLVYQAMTI